MKKILISAFLIILLIPSLNVFGLDMEFYNDGSSWGFIPEWDDYETYALKLKHDLDSIAGSLKYSCYTWRAESVDNAGRIDSIELSLGSILRLISESWLNIDLKADISGRFYDDWYGMLIQTGWHGNVEVARAVPAEYEEPFFQFVVPAELHISTDLLPGAELQLKASAGWPEELSAGASAVYTVPNHILPLKLTAGYDAGRYSSPSESYNISKQMQTGLFFSNQLSYWPLEISRIYYFQKQWGTGSFGFNFGRPGADAYKNVIIQIIFSGIFHQAYGVKIERRILESIFTDNFSIAVTGTSLNGWIPDYIAPPDGGRFSSLSLGAAPSYSIPAGPVIIDLSGAFNIGIRQNNFYPLAPTLMAPELSDNHLFLEAGAGVRLLFPFFFERMIGPGIDAMHQFRLASFSGEADNSKPVKPFRLNLSLAVTGIN